MIVAMDIGNTNIKAAVFEGSRLVKRWRCATDPAMTSDQYGIIMADLFRYHNLNMQAVEGIMISSVVPTINYTIEHMCRDYFHLEPRLLVPGMKTGLNIRYENPRELGSDRIANAVAVSTLYGGPAIFIDFGTATTYGVISAKSEFLGGAIGPGLRMMNRALSTGRAKLPSIELVLPPQVIGKIFQRIELAHQFGLYDPSQGLNSLVVALQVAVQRAHHRTAAAQQEIGDRLPVLLHKFIGNGKPFFQVKPVPIHRQNSGTNLRPVFLSGNHRPVVERKDRVRLGLHLRDKYPQLLIFPQQPHGRPPGQASDVSKSASIPLTERLFQQTPGKLFQFLVFHVVADQPMLQ